MKLSWIPGFAGMIAAAALLAVPANATLVLTGAGTADGFSLSTFATTNPGNTGCCNGPFGVAVDGAGNVQVGLGSGSHYVFANTDGQTIASALYTTSVNTYVGAFASSGGAVYGSTDGGSFYKFNNDGTVADSDAFPGLSSALGMWTNPVNGHIIAESGVGLVDIDPVAKNWRVINNSIFGDGVSVSPDGTVAYVAFSSCIQAVTIATGAMGTCYNTSGDADGTGIISGGAFDGYIVANTNDGNIDLIDPMSNTYVTIASGGTRGDYTSPDPTNGSLFLTYGDMVARLSCPNCSFVGPPPPPAVPEPDTLSIFAAVLAGAAFVGRRRRKQKARKAA